MSEAIAFDNGSVLSLSDREIERVNGGIGPVAAYAIAIGIGGLFVAAWQAGYQLGADMAGNGGNKNNEQLK